jgi:hypothetical protein
LEKVVPNPLKVEQNLPLEKVVPNPLKVGAKLAFGKGDAKTRFL